MQRKSSFGKYFRAFVHRHVPPKPKYSCSSTSSSSLSSLNSHPSSSSLSAMADMSFTALRDYLSAIDNPFKLWQARQISKDAEDYVNEMFSKYKKLDVSRVDFDELVEEEKIHDGFGKNEVEFRNLTWYLHPGGCKVLMRFSTFDSVELIVDNHWTSKDVIALDDAIGMFRSSVEQIYLDAPVVELIIASLSMIDLDRWYAFLCFMKATNNNEMHLCLDRVNHNPVDDNHIYFKKCTHLIIRTTARDSAHLARILDYGVRSQLVVCRQKLEIIKVIITDVPQLTNSNRELNRNILRFRCWAGSAGFDDRYQQSYVNFI